MVLSCAYTKPIILVKNNVRFSSRQPACFNLGRLSRRIMIAVMAQQHPQPSLACPE
jgi:hypothetical protein